MEWWWEFGGRTPQAQFDGKLSRGLVAIINLQ
jgi:hypothetical protein